jgi:hypothetical protein
MDPYLETADLWADVHHELISQIQAALNARLRPHHVARIMVRVYVSDEDDPGRQAIIPDFPSTTRERRHGATRDPLPIPRLIDNEIEEARVEIRHRESNTLVTVIEVLSPTN